MNDTSHKGHPAPAVSVLLSSHNGATYLRQALESMATQTFTDWEWVLVDNASTDETPAIMSAYAAAMPGRVRVVRNDTKLDLAESLNRGLDAARGRYIARMDDDDVAHPDRLRLQVGEMENDAALVLLGALAYRVDERSGLADEFTWYLDPVRLRICLCWYNPLMHASVMYRRLDASGKPVAYPLAYSYAEDYGMWAGMAAVGRVKIMKEKLMTYRKRAGSMTGSGRDLQLASSAKVSAWYTRQLLAGSALAAATPEEVRAWVETLDYPTRARAANVKQLFIQAGRAPFATPAEVRLGFLMWAVPFLDRYRLHALAGPSRLRLLGACGVGSAGRYLLRRLAER